MRRQFAITFVLCALLSGIVGVSGLEARPAAGPPNDFVLAAFEYQGTSFFVNSWGGPAGENPQGHLKVAFLKGRVDCLVVHGNEALVIADVPKHFIVIVLVLRDNYPAMDELVFFQATQGVSPDTCPEFDGTGGEPGTPVPGDINIHDA